MASVEENFEAMLRYLEQQTAKKSAAVPSTTPAAKAAATVPLPAPMQAQPAKPLDTSHAWDRRRRKEKRAANNARIAEYKEYLRATERQRYFWR